MPTAEALLSILSQSRQQHLLSSPACREFEGNMANYLLDIKAAGKKAPIRWMNLSHGEDYRIRTTIGIGIFKPSPQYGEQNRLITYCPDVTELEGSIE